MTAITIVLPAMYSRSEKICGGREAGGGVALELWQQARAGLLATVVGRKTFPATVRVLSYRQVFDADDHLLQQRSRVTVGREQRAFGAAASARDFARMGFVVDANGLRTYYAPDGDVLLDPRFAATHCFSVVVDSVHHPNDIGLAFDPAKNASTDVVDVAGTLWLRRGNPELRSMQFRYVGIEASAAAANAGGSITFATMSNGVVVLSRWSLIAPVVVRRNAARLAPGEFPDRITQVDRIGGIVADASWPDGVRWHGPVGTLVGRVVRGAFGLPARDVTVWLTATADTVTTDANGVFRFDDLLPARYTVRAQDMALAAFHAEPPVQADVVVPGKRDSLPNLALLSYEDIERRICQGEPVNSGTTVMMGRLTADGGPPDWTSALELTWPGDGTAKGARTNVSRDGGRFYVCNLPRRHFVAVRALHGPDVVLDTVVTLPDAPTTMVAFALKERGRASATGTVVGFAADSAGNPVPGVEIIVGLDVHTRTDSLGNFVVPAVKAGTTLVRARRLGFAPVAMATVVPPDGAASLSVTMQPVTLLPTVIARADSMAELPDNQMHKLDLFYQRSAQRRMSGLGGEFFTETDIERRHPVKLSDLLEGKARRLPQCRNATVGGVPRYELFIDDLPYGTFTMDSPEVLDAIPVSWVVGVEVYTSVAELPVEAMGNGCAAIFVWLR